MSTTNHSAIVVGAAANAGTINGPLGQLDAAMGDVDALTTAAGTLTAAVNELDAELGNLALLTTDATGNHVAALNSVKLDVDDAVADIGNLGLLTSDATGNLVAAINSVKADVDDAKADIGPLGLLISDSTGNLVAAINSVKVDADAAAADADASASSLAVETAARIADVDAETAARTLADNTMDDRIDTIVLGSGTSSAEVVDARIGINYGVAPTVLSETIDWAAADIYNVKAYGATGDGTTNDQTAINAAITAANTAGGGVVYFPRGVYLVDFVTLKNNVILQGAGRYASVIKTTATSPTADRGVLRIVDTLGVPIERITIRDLQVLNLVDGISRRCILLSTTSHTLRDVTIEDCYFYSSSDSHNVVQFGTGTDGMLLYNVQINRCKFEGEANATTPTNGCLLRINAGSSIPYANNSHMVVSNCEFINGVRAVECVTVGGAGPNFAFTNNHVYGQTMGGISIYHMPSRVTGNYIHHLTAIAQSNNDSGAIWMDTAGFEGSVVADNMIQHITGNAIFVEDNRAGSIANNQIEHCFKRTGDTFDATTLTAGASDNTSDGGHGILIAGNCLGTNIAGNTIRGCASNAIFVARDMGPHWDGYYLKQLTIAGNYLIDYGENGIEFDTEWLGQSGGHKIIGNHIESNVAGAGAGIKNTGDTFSAGTMTIIGNTIDGGQDNVPDYALHFESASSTTAKRIIANILKGNLAAFNAPNLYGTFAFNDIDGTNTGALGSSGQILGNKDIAADSERLDLNGQYLALNLKTPGSASATGTVGQICWDTGHIYVCTATNQWERVALATW